MKKRVIGLLGIAFTSWLGFAYVPGDATRCDEDETLATADAVDLALDFVPGVNTVKDLLCLGLGVNPVTGDKVNDFETMLLVSCIVAPWATRRAARAIEPHRGLWVAQTREWWTRTRGSVGRRRLGI